MFMKKSLGLIMFLLLCWVSIVNNCIFKNTDYSLEELRLVRKCYLGENPPQYTTTNDPLIQHEILYYVSELCTKTHRLVIFASKELDLNLEYVNVMLEHVFNGVNYDIRGYKGVVLSELQWNRLRRYLLEKVFYHEYKILRPNTTFLQLNVPTLKNDYQLAEKINMLPKIYGNTTITYYITKSDYGNDVVVTKLV